MLHDFERKMVFIGGARQVGKTSLAGDILAGHQVYLNWDVAEHREKIFKRKLPAADLLVFDKIHKYRFPGCEAWQISATGR